MLGVNRTGRSWAPGPSFRGASSQQPPVRLHKKATPVESKGPYFDHSQFPADPTGSGFSTFASAEKQLLGDIIEDRNALLLSITFSTLCCTSIDSGFPRRPISEYGASFLDLRRLPKEATWPDACKRVNSFHHIVDEYSDHGVGCSNGCPDATFDFGFGHSKFLTSKDLGQKIRDDVYRAQLFNRSNSEIIEQRVRHVVVLAWSDWGPSPDVLLRQLGVGDVLLQPGIQRIDLGFFQPFHDHEENLLRKINPSIRLGSRPVRDPEHCMKHLGIQIKPWLMADEEFVDLASNVGNRATLSLQAVIRIHWLTAEEEQSFVQGCCPRLPSHCTVNFGALIFNRKTGRDITDQVRQLARDSGSQQTLESTASDPDHDATHFIGSDGCEAIPVESVDKVTKVSRHSVVSAMCELVDGCHEFQLHDQTNVRIPPGYMTPEMWAEKAAHLVCEGKLESLS